MASEASVTFKKLEKSSIIREEHQVRVTVMNHIVEILSLAQEPKMQMTVKKLDKNHYLNLLSGEIFEAHLSENRGQNIAGIKRTQKAIRNLINSNFTGAANELFITLSYGENMTDTKRLYKDYDVFWKRFKRKYPDAEYLSVIEPQGRGAWHCHVLIKFIERNKIYISNNDVIWPMWGHGFVKTKSLKDVDNIGAYLNAYLSDVEICDDNAEVIMNAIVANNCNMVELPDGTSKDMNENHVDLQIVEKDVTEDGVTQKKKYVKGARLHMYPVDMKIYRCSRGIKKAETVKMTYAEAKKIVGPEPANYSRTIVISQDEKPLNAITYEQYNMKRN
jgi:hypothetical protein